MTSAIAADGAVTRTRRFATPIAVLQAYVIVGGAVSFLGWVVNQPILTDWSGTGISIQPNTTVAAIAAGAAVLLLSRGYRRIAAILGAFVGLIGATVLIQYLSGVDLGIDTILLFDRTWGRVGVTSNGRMGPAAATSWALIGVGVLLASRRRGSRARRCTPAVALIPVIISALGLIGYLYGASSLYALPALTVIALQTTSFILAVSIGLLLCVPEHGAIRLLGEDSPGGVLTRRIVPAIVLVPVALGFIRLVGERWSLYDGPFGSALRTVSEIALFVIFTWWAAAAINQQSRQRKAADRELRASQQHVLDTLENITDAFVTLDREWRFTYVNGEAERQLRRTRGELIGKSYWDAFPESNGSIARRELRRAAAERVNVTFEEFNPALQRWWTSKACPTSKGELAIYFEDVTALKAVEADLEQSRIQLEEELSDMRHLHRVSSELMAEDDPQRLYESLLDAAVGIMRSDFASMQMLYPERGERGELRLLAHRGFRPESAEAWAWVRVASGCTCGEALQRGERVIAPDVETCDFLPEAGRAEYRRSGIRAVQSTPLLSRSNHIVGMISTHWRVAHEPAERELRLFDILARQAADLIERKHAERQREIVLENERSARSDAERAVRLKDEFLATLSHELRTPLNAVIGWSAILKEDLLDPEKARYAVDIIERNGRLQAQLITDLLDVSRIISGKMRLELQAVDLQAVVDAAVDSMTPAADAKGVHMQQVIEPFLDPITGDPARLQQVVWNLLSNAVKFTPSGGRVEIALASVDAHVEIRVSDTGEGIAPEFLPHIFERFRQADASESRSHGGLGLGLAIVKQFVELHGGRVRAASGGRGQGATFVIELPLSTPAAQEPGVLHPFPSPERAASIRRAPVHLKGERVLVVDDDADALTMIRRVLEDAGAEVSTANSANAALDRLRGKPFALIVSDIGMPGVDGLELIREIRKRGIRAPAVALTAFARAEDRAKALANGYQFHLAKPVEAAELLAIVASLSREEAGASTSFA